MIVKKARPMMTKQQCRTVELYPGEFAEAKEYVARSRPYILGHLPQDERIQLEDELDGCLMSNGNTDIIAQRNILRRESDLLWEWKRGVQAQLDENDSDEKA